MTKSLRFATVVILLLATLNDFATTLAAWSLTSTTTSATTMNVNSASAITVSSGSISYQATDIYTSTWPTNGTDGKYWDFTVTTDAMHTMTISGFSIDVGRTATGPSKMDILYSTTGFTGSTSIVSGGTVGTTFGTYGGSYSNLPISVPVSTTVEFRVYGTTASSTGNFQINNILLTGTYDIVTTNFYWNGGTTSGTGTAAGGNGTWFAGTKNWISPTNDLSGIATAWTSAASSVANFANGSGTVTMNTNITAGSTVIGTAYTWAPSTTISLTSPVTLSAALTIAPAAGTFTMGSAIGGTGSLVHNGAGATILSGTNTYSGGTTLTAGTLNINSTTALGATASTFTINGGTIDNSSAAGLTLANNNAQTWAGNFTYTGTKALNMGTGAVTMTANTAIAANTSTLTEGGAIGGAYTLTMSGSGTLALATGSTYPTLVINSGIVSGSGQTAFGATPAGLTPAQTTINGGTLQATGGISFSANRGVTLGASGGTFDVNGSTITMGSVIAGTAGGSLTVASTAGGGTLLLNGACTYGSSGGGGATTINNGTLQLGTTNALPTTTAVTIANTTGAILDVNGNTQTIASLTGSANSDVKLSTGSAALTINGAATSVYSGLIEKAGSLIVNGSSTIVTLSGANTYSGGTTLTAGTLNINNGGATSAIGTGALTINGGTIDNTSSGALTVGSNNAQTWAGNYAFTGTKSLNMGTGAVTMTANTTITANANTLTEGGAISGAYTLTKAGAGTLALVTGSSYPTFVINGGTVSATGQTAFGATPGGLTAAQTTMNGGTIQATGGITFSANRGVTLGANGGTFDVNGNTIALGSVIAGTSGGSLTVASTAGGGTLQLNAACTYGSSGGGGNTTINNGTLQLGITNALPTTTAVTIANATGAILDVNGNTQTIASLAGGGGTGGKVTIGTGTLTVNGSASTNFAGVISQTGALVFSGNGGMLTLSGANTYTGATTVSAGTLNVTGSTAAGSAVGVTTGATNSATLAGNGTVNGNVTLTGTSSSVLALVSPGDATSAGSAGTLATSTTTSTGVLTFNNYSGYKCDINAISGTAGTNWDLVTAYSIAFATSSNIKIYVTGNPASFSNTTGYTWKIASATGANVTTLGNATFTFDISGFTPTLAGAFSVVLAANNKDINLVYTPNPAIVLTNTNLAQIAADATPIPGTSKVILERFEADVTVANAILNSVAFNTAGTYVNTTPDISKLELYYSTTTTMPGSSLASTTTIPATGGTVTFSSLNTTINSGASGYFWITADIALGATATRTVGVKGTGSSGLVLSFTTGTPTGTINDPTLQTITAPTVPNLTISGTPTNYGTICVGSPASSVQYTITNNGGVTASGVTVVSSDPQFVVSGLSSTTIAVSGTATYNVTFTPSGAGAQSATITVASTTTGSNSPQSSVSGTGLAKVTPSVSINSVSSVCSNQSVLFTPVPLNLGGGTAAYAWTINGTANAASGGTYTQNSWTSGNSVLAVMTVSGGCVTSTTASSNSVAPTVTTAVTPSVSINTVSSVCSNQSVLFTPAPLNLGGGTAAYAWTINGTVNASTASTYTQSSWTSGNSVLVVMTVTGGCVTSTTANSNTVAPTVTTAVTPSVTINTVSSVCSNQSVTFTPVPLNLGGGSASYEWTLNGTANAASGGTYTQSSWTSGNSVKAVLTVTGGCVTTTTANSNTVTPTVTTVVTPAVSINTVSSVCSNQSVTFTASPSNLGGGTAAYAWTINGTANSASGTSYTQNAWTSGNSVQAVMTVTGGCVTSTIANSNTVTPTVTTAQAPSVTIAITTGSNPSCSGSSVVFTSTANNLGGGAVSAYQWSPSGTSSTFSSTSLSNGATVVCSITVSGGCVTSTTAASAGTVMTIYSLPGLASGLTNQTRCGSGNVTFTVADPLAGSSIEWSTDGSTNNDGSGAGGTGNVSIIKTVPVTEYARISNSNGCKSTAWVMATGTAITAPSISASPTNQSATTASAATFTVSASNAASYSWYESTNGGVTWGSSPLTTTGVYDVTTTPGSLIITNPTIGMNGYQYEVVVNGNSPCGSVTSSAASLTVTAAPVVLYLHNFNDGATSSPYNTSPTSTSGTPTGVFNSNLSSSSWVSSNSAFTNFSGQSGQSLVIQPANGSTSTMTLTFNVASGYSCSITSFNFWSQRSSTNGPNIGSITINGTTVASAITVPTSGTTLGTTNVANAVNNLTGTITVVINLTTTAASGTNFRLDNFTLSGFVNPLNPAVTIAADHPTAGNISAGTGPNNIGGMSLTVTSAASTLSSLQVTTAGTYASSDIQANGFQLYYNTLNSLSGATLLGSVAAVGNGGTLNFTGLNQSIPVGTEYLFVTANISPTATNNNTIGLSDIVFSNIGLSGTLSGTNPVTPSITSNAQIIKVPGVVISTPAVVNTTINQCSSGNVIYTPQFAVTNAGATLSSAAFTLTGNYKSSDLGSTPFNLYYTTGNVFSSAIQLGTSQASTSTGSGETINFTGLSQAFAAGATGYLWLTVDANNNATIGATITVSASNLSDYSFGGITPTGSPVAGTAEEFVTPAAIDVTAQTTSSCINSGTTVSWTNPTCFDQVIVVANQGTSVTFSPSGTGYTGTAAYSTANQVVYAGTGSSVAVTGLSDGLQYTYEIYTRKGTNWSTGVSTTCTPAASYCAAASGSSGGSNEYISNVTLNTLNNSSGSSTYHDYTALAATSLQQGQSYTITITNGHGYSSDLVKVYIDYNQNGSFEDAGELVYTSSTGTGPYSHSIAIPAGSSSCLVGNTRMRVRLESTSGSTDDCGTIAYGEVEDYTVNITAANPAVTIAAYHPAAGYIAAGSGPNSIGGMSLTVANSAASLTSLTVTTAGTYLAGDIQANGFQLYYNTTNSLSGATLLSTVAAVSNGSNLTFNGFTQSIPVGTEYLFVTAKINSGATNGHTIGLTVTAFSNIGLTGTLSGTNPVTGSITSNAQTILVPAVVISTPVVSGSTISQCSTNNVIYSPQIAVTNVTATLSAVKFVLTGNYQSGDLASTPFKLYYTTTNAFTSTTQIGSALASTSTGTGETITFTGLAQSIASGATGYLWLTVDAGSAATAGHTLTVSASSLSDYTFAGGSPSGSPVAGTTQTIVTSASVDVSTAATSGCALGSTTITWINPSCYDGIMIVARATSAITSIPTGNGSAYTANAAFGTSGTDAGLVAGTEYAVYKNTGSSVTITGLTNGTLYNFKIFVRKGNTWSSGVTVSCTPSSTGQFTPGNLVIYRVGPESGGLTSSAQPIVLDEYSVSGSGGISVSLPTTTSGNVNRITSSGSATSEGEINLSPSGNYVTVTGYDAPVGTLSVNGNSASSTPRVIGRVDLTGSPSIFTTAINDGYGKDNFRSAITNSGTNFWLSGNSYSSSSNAGIRYVTNTSSSSTATSSLQLNDVPDDTRVIKIFNGPFNSSSTNGLFTQQLYFSTASSAASSNQGVYQLGTGLPTGNTTATYCNGKNLNSNNTNPNSFIYLDRSGTGVGPNVMYVTDDQHASASTGYIIKYYFDGTTWHDKGHATCDLGGLYGLTGYVDGSGNAVLYATAVNGSTPSYIVTFTDNAAASSTISNNSFTTLVTGTSNEAFRGISFTPTKIAVQPSNQAACVNANATFTIAMAEGPNAQYAYQWFEQVGGTGAWASITDGGIYGGAATNILTLTGVTAGMNTNKYECVVTYMSQAFLVSSAVTLTVNPLPTVTITNPSAVCSPATVDLTASAVTSGSTAGLTYSYWTNSGATSSYSTPSAAAAGTYYIEGTTAASCSAIQPVVVTVNPTPTVTITNPSAVCSPTTVDLTASAVTSGSTSGLTYTYWTNAGATSSYATPSAATAGTYYIKGTTGLSCSAIQPVVVTVNPTPTVTITNPSAVCSPSTVDLTASAVTSGSTSGLTYTYWTNAGATSSYATPSAATAGTYYIKGTTGLSCSAVQSVIVTVNPTPTVTITNPSAVCSPATVDLTGSAVTSGSTAGLTYSYWTNAGATSSYATPSAATAGTYYIKGTTGLSCSAIQPVVVTVNALPVVSNITASPAIACINSPITLTATTSGGASPFTYSWASVTTGNGLVEGSITASATATPTTLNTQTYTATVTDHNGCVGTVTGSTNVTVSSPPSSVTASNGGPFVVGQTISLSAAPTNLSSYQWSAPDGYSANGQTVNRSGATLAMTETYTVTATNSSGCTATASTDVLVATNATYIWNGNTSSDWTVQTNWTPTAPTGGPNHCAVDVIIPAVSNNHNPVISSLISVGNVEMDANAQLTLNGANMNVCKNWQGSNASSAAVVGTGLVTLNGSSAQLISGYTKFQELMLDNSGGAQMQANSAVDVYTALDLKTGTFDATNGTLTFKSTSVTNVGIINNFSTNYGGTITGNIKAERYYDGSTTYNQHYMGSPVNTPALSQFGATGTPGYVIPQPTCTETALDMSSPYGTVFSFHESHGASCELSQWKVETTGNATNGVGYSVLKTGAGTLTLAGAPNLSDVTVTSLANTNGWTNQSAEGRPYSSGWQLLANPFLATIVIDPSINRGSFDDQVWVWNTEGNNAGSYTRSYTVAPFQAFIVHKTSAGGNASYLIKASERVVTPQTFYQLNANEITITASNTANGLLDDISVGFNTNATDTFDAQIDANKPAGALGRHTIYSVNNGKWMGRNILHDLATTSTVPVGFEPGATGTYTLSFGGLNGFEPTSYIYLEDKALHVMYNVRNGDYTFTANSADNWDRFVLHFTPPAEISTVDAGCTASGTIDIQQPGTADWIYTLTDANNAIVTSGVLNQSQPVLVNVAAGAYTLTLTDTNNYVAVKSIVVNGPQMITAAFQMSADTVEALQSVVLTASATGAASYEWNLGNGLTATGANVTVNYAEPGVYTLSLLVTSQSGCGATQTQTITVMPASTTGLNSITGTGKLNIWSNSNRVFVDFTALQKVNASITIYNILGQELCSDYYVSSNIYQKEIDNIDAAYLIVRVKNDDEVITKKVFITNYK